MRRFTRSGAALLAAAVAGGALIASFEPQAQQLGKIHRIGVLTSGGVSEGFRRNLRDLGYVEGGNYVLEVRDTKGLAEKADELAIELVRSKADVIVATHPNAVFAAKRATATIPIVMVHTPDPVQLGLVASLARPGGNITGVTTLSVEVSTKQLELLKEVIPRASRMGVLWNPNNPWHPITVKALQSGSGSLGFQLQIHQVRGPGDFGKTFETLLAERVEGVLVLADPMTYVHRKQLAELALRHRLPMVGSLKEYAEAGSLLSYWADQRELGQRAVSYVDKILKGAKPAELPIELPRKYELVANLKTAKALGLAIPPSLLLRADRVIE